MDLLDIYYKGFLQGELSAGDLARATSHVNTEQIDPRKYNSTFVAIVFRQSVQNVVSIPKTKQYDIGFVRKAKAEELSAVEELFAAFQSELYRGEKDPLSPDALVVDIPSSERYPLKLPEEKNLFGALWYEILPEDIFYVAHLYVRPEARKFGLGRKLVEEGLETAFSFGCSKIELRAPEDVVPFYRKLGFKPYARNCDGMQDLYKKL